MFRARWLLSALMIGLVLAPGVARARSLGVDVWTDRGKDAVYEPGEPVQLEVRASDDAYVLVYDIDSEGYVRVLFPHGGNSGYLVGRHTYRIPESRSGQELVIEGPVGQGYIVALASTEPFNALPWYLRPYDPQAEGAGYVGAEDDDENVTSDGRIVGDPFVAMERIRREALENPNDENSFATAYTSYYVHQPVRYPRYLCYDCHRPGYWAWWDGWDPYYSTCSAFDFRVYWGWSWGPRYWFGNVPYFCYVPRCYPCAPYDRPWYSSWGGWRQWNGLWSGHLRRSKTPPPPGYAPPGRYDFSGGRGSRPLPPGYLPANYMKGERRVPIGANRPNLQPNGWRGGSDRGARPTPSSRPQFAPNPAGRSGDDSGRLRPQGQGRLGPAYKPGSQGRFQRPNYEPRPTPRFEQPRGQSRPAPANEPSRGQSRPAPTPRYEPSHGDSRPAPSRAPESRPTPMRGGGDRGGERRGGR
jgi:hypothetical protein